MAEKSKESRGKKVVDGILDAGAVELQSIGIEAVHGVIQEIREWVLNKYSSLKLGSNNNAESALKNLEMRIELSNKNVEIGMEKKEIAVMWAMRKIGYSEDETRKVLDLANTAYQPKE